MSKDRFPKNWEQLIYGPVNGHIVATIFKSAMRRAIEAIRRERMIFVTRSKIGYGGKRNDKFTSADIKAQAIYVKAIRECFPSWGIVAEEKRLKIRCRIKGITVFVTLDGLDGTAAFIRGESHGIGTMASLVVNGQVVCAYVGDVMTGEIYGFRPGSNHVHRIGEFGQVQRLKINPKKKLSEQYVLLREHQDRYDRRIQTMIKGWEGFHAEGVFRGVEVSGGSIGTNMARLWKGSVGAMILKPGYETPWDLAPVLGICQKLGFVFLKLTPAGKLERLEPRITGRIRKTNHETIIIHESRISELKQFTIFFEGR